MTFDPPTLLAYATHIEELKKSGRIINATSADGNCLFRSLRKGLVGIEEYIIIVTDQCCLDLSTQTPTLLCPI